LVVPARELAEAYGFAPDEIFPMLQERLRSYRSTLPYDRRRALERFEFVDFARKVVGVGSVGTRAWIALLQGRDGQDPLFLQIKEATASVLEDHLPKSRFRQPGERVVQGQRLMQAASDIFLGWTKGVQEGRFYYWRQLRDMKGSALIELFDPEAMNYYAGVCGWTLARAHARSGDPVAISAYLGSSDRFDQAMTDFAVRYADQNERDYDAFVQAIRSGKLEATEGSKRNPFHPNGVARRIGVTCPVEQAQKVVSSRVRDREDGSRLGSCLGGRQGLGASAHGRRRARRGVPRSA
jgi:hypothetical protein